MTFHFETAEAAVRLQGHCAGPTAGCMYKPRRQVLRGLQTLFDNVHRRSVRVRQRCWSGKEKSQHHRGVDARSLPQHTDLGVPDAMQASDSARARFRAARGSPLVSADAEYGQDAPPTPFELEVLEGALMVATGALLDLCS